MFPVTTAFRIFSEKVEKNSEFLEFPFFGLKSFDLTNFTISEFRKRVPNIVIFA